MLGWRIRDVVSPTHYILEVLYNRGMNVTFVRHVNALFMKYSIPLALFAAVRTSADGVNAECIVIDLFVFRHQFTFRIFLLIYLLVLASAFTRAG